MIKVNNDGVFADGNRMNEEYRQKEQEFERQTDSLCENISPALCDCSACPTRELCSWLCECDPNRRR